jgi:hypothetical protein
MRHQHSVSLLVLVLAAGLAACDSRQDPVTESPFRLTASIQEIMNSLVDPAADGIWDAFSTTATAAGTETRQPTTDEEWQVARHHAIALIEAGNLLLIDGRKVAQAGKPLDDAGTPGLLTAPEIEKTIAGDRAGFVKAVHALQNTGLAVLAAIDTKNPEAVFQAAGRIERNCEACHVKFWYPNAKGPNLADFAKPAAAGDR